MSESMSEEQLRSLLDKLKVDAGLRDQFKAAADLESFLTLAHEAGFDISETAYRRFQEDRLNALSDNLLENASGGADCIGMTEVMWGF